MGGPICTVGLAGIEGTGSYERGAGPAHQLGRGMRVVGVDRADGQDGASGQVRPDDAIEALAGSASGRAAGDPGAGRRGQRSGADVVTAPAPSGPDGINQGAVAGPDRPRCRVGASTAATCGAATWPRCGGGAAATVGVAGAGLRAPGRCAQHLGARSASTSSAARVLSGHAPGPLSVRGRPERAKLRIAAGTTREAAALGGRRAHLAAPRRAQRLALRADRPAACPRSSPGPVTRQRTDQPAACGGSTITLGRVSGTRPAGPYVDRGVQRGTGCPRPRSSGLACNGASPAHQVGYRP